MSAVRRVDAQAPDAGVIAEAAAVLRAGGLVAFPTETVYGLGANALDAAAVGRIFAAKGRPADDPIIVHVAGLPGLAEVAASVPPAAACLAAALWPGPLTVVVPRGAAVPRVVTAGGDTVAVRSPAHAVAHALITAAGVPVAAPSANRFGRTSPTTAAHVLAELGDRIDLLLDGGPCAVGVESTVVDCTVEPPRVLRPGGATLEALRAVLPNVALAEPATGVGGPGDGAPGGPPAPERAPGRMARHYAPRARLVLVAGTEGTPDGAVAHVVALAAEGLAARGVAVGLLAMAGDPAPPGVRREVLAPLGDDAGAARRLYGALHDLDAAGCAAIVARDLGTAGLGLALRDRLARAAEGRVVWVAGDGAREVAAAVAAVMRRAIGD